MKNGEIEYLFDYTYDIKPLNIVAKLLSLPHADYVEDSMLLNEALAEVTGNRPLTRIIDLKGHEECLQKIPDGVIYNYTIVSNTALTQIDKNKLMQALEDRLKHKRFRFDLYFIRDIAIDNSRNSISIEILHNDSLRQVIR